MDVTAVTSITEHVPPAITPAFAGWGASPPTFVSQAIAVAVSALSDFAGADAVIGAFSPPRFGDCQPDGMITLCLSTSVRDAEIAIDFGSRADDGIATQRLGFDRASFDAQPDNPHACGLVAHDLREAWTIVHGILDKLAPASIRLSFGA